MVSSKSWSTTLWREKRSQTNNYNGWHAAKSHFARGLVVQRFHKKGGWENLTERYFKWYLCSIQRNSRSWCAILRIMYLVFFLNLVWMALNLIYWIERSSKFKWYSPVWCNVSFHTNTSTCTVDKKRTTSLVLPTRLEPLGTRGWLHGSTVPLGKAFLGIS